MTNQVEMMCFEEGGRGSQAQEHGWLMEMKKDKETISPQRPHHKSILSRLEPLLSNQLEQWKPD